MSRYYLTTPIFYVNDAPHVGHAYCAVNADALSRWHRLIGDEVFFLTGTDEHGAKVADAATMHGVTPKEWADTVVQRFEGAWSDLGLSNDDFIRTTESRHHRSVQKFLSTIFDNGYIKKGVYRGLYCIACEDYYTEEALDGRDCPVHHRPVTEMEEENYFFTLSTFQDRLLDWYESHPDAIRPATKRNEALSFIKGGLHDISITRTSLDWGVEVPWDPKHVFYVWYDALVNYLTAIGYDDDDTRVAHWWPAVHHLIGKEIIRFHCVWWPAMCMAAGLEPPANIFVHGWLLVGGEKLSKSGGVGLTEISPSSLCEDFGVDAIRYHLVRDLPLGSDGDFSYEGIVTRYNADLANNLGNLLSRVATVVGSKCGGVAPASDPQSALKEVAARTLEDASAAWERSAPHEALEATWRLIGATNASLEAAEPWKADPGPVVDAVLGDALEVLRLVALLISPVMPTTASELLRRIGSEARLDAARLPGDGAWGSSLAGASVIKGEPLFPRRKA